MNRSRIERMLLVGMGSVLILYLAAPVVALTWKTTLPDFVEGFRHKLAGPALRLSLFTTSLSLLIVVTFGTPLAWMLSQAKSTWARSVEAAVQLPIVMPPAVAGVALLFAFGRQGLFTGWLYPSGWSASFSTMAVIMAEIFVSAPFYVQAATSAFRRIDRTLFVVARTLGAGPLRVFLRVAVPVATPGLIAGGAMSWARSLGEFGATLMFAGNLEGRTQTLPLAIYTALETDLRAAQALSVFLMVVALALVVFVRLVSRDWVERGD